MHNHSYENQFNLHVNEILFHIYDGLHLGLDSKTHFEKKAYKLGNSEVAS